MRHVGVLPPACRNTRRTGSWNSGRARSAGRSSAAAPPAPPDAGRSRRESALETTTSAAISRPRRAARRPPARRSTRMSRDLRIAPDVCRPAPRSARPAPGPACRCRPWRNARPSAAPGTRSGCRSRSWRRDCRPPAADGSSTRPAAAGRAHGGGPGHRRSGDRPAGPDRAATRAMSVQPLNGTWPSRSKPIRNMRLAGLHEALRSPRHRPGDTRATSARIASGSPEYSKTSPSSKRIR